MQHAIFVIQVNVFALYILCYIKYIFLKRLLKLTIIYFYTDVF